MSEVKWCDPGDHAFKAGTKGAQSMSMTVQEEDEKGNPVPKLVAFDACPEHGFRPTATAPALAGAENGAD